MRKKLHLLMPVKEAEKLAQAPYEMGNEPWPQIATPNRLSASRQKATDHLANERTFLAWIRTALAVSTFGAALGRLRGPVHLHHLSVLGSWSSSAYLVGGLLLLSVGLMLAALGNFLHLRRAIEQERFQTKTRITVLLTILSCLMAGVMALDLLAS